MQSSAIEPSTSNVADDVAPLDLILGTAGHIDHGKTALIRALTGTETDRLPEEKRRGITIELGFAQLDLGDVRLGIVDVPGHEKLVRNMLAGATGMDLALLVVAADDSVKPQTREHLEILRLLDLKAGVIALTKCDLAADDWLELVAAEVRETVAGTFLRDAPIVRTSATTGEGIDRLRAALCDAARQVAVSAREKMAASAFRMAIDRCFTIQGHGTVVTGSVNSGRLCVGDSLELQPDGETVRVRGLQNHDRPVEEVHRGQRAAINLAGVERDAIGSGSELASPGHLEASRLMSVHMHLLANGRWRLKNRGRVKVHLGTAELSATVDLLGRKSLAPGESALAQLHLASPAVASWHQVFVMRSESPAATIGGGMVLDPTAEKIRAARGDGLALLEQLADPDPLQRVAAAVRLAGWNFWQPASLARTTGVDAIAPVLAELVERGDLVDVQLSPTRRLLLHRDTIAEMAGAIEKTLSRMHDESPHVRFVPLAPLRSKFAFLPSAALLEFVLDAMVRANQLSRRGDSVALAGRGPQLSKAEQKLFESLVARYRQAGLAVPMVSELVAEAKSHQKAIPGLLKLAASEGELVEITDQFFLHCETEAALRAKLIDRFVARQGATLSEIRETLATSRKYAVPLCEYFDRMGFTRREGDLRFFVAHGKE
ncbi:MAG: selenocysteine-specific translation elongation factor [Planctomycetales bacterium]|nr:selenocysteine-specific translation elongation factor [Planctomycetales bacterium]